MRASSPTEVAGSTCASAGASRLPRVAGVPAPGDPRRRASTPAVRGTRMHDGAREHLRRAAVNTWAALLSFRSEDETMFALRRCRYSPIHVGAIFAFLCTGAASAPEPPEQAGVVSHVKVVSDKVKDVSSYDAWKASYIKPG